MNRITRAVPMLLLLLSMAALALPRRGVTVPLYAARNGMMCGQCHFDPNGGGPRNEFGFTFAKNRHTLVADTSGEWKDLGTLVNRVGDNFPLYFGVNQRFMLLANSMDPDNHLDRAGFFDMESSIHMAFQPHSRLTLVYSRDGFDQGSSTKEAYGLITGFPLEGYLRAGRFRVPFGLRMDDHTVSTRNGFLDFYYPTATFVANEGDTVRAQFLPYDARLDDMGLEAGATMAGNFGRVAFTNGGTHPLFGSTRAQTVSAKVGHNWSHYQGAFSFYDDYHFDPFAAVGTRGTRWGYYGIAHAGELALLYEVAAGTDAVGSHKFNSLAYWAELDYRITTGINARLRYDRLELDRGNSDDYIKDLNTHDRYAVEGEFDPVPFAQLRWTLRLIKHKADAFRSTGTPIEDEKQAYLQFHFSY